MHLNVEHKCRTTRTQIQLLMQQFWICMFYVKGACCTVHQKKLHLIVGLLNNNLSVNTEIQIIQSAGFYNSSPVTQVYDIHHVHSSNHSAQNQTLDYSLVILLLNSLLFTYSWSFLSYKHHPPPHDFLWFLFFFLTHNVSEIGGYLLSQLT